MFMLGRCPWLNKYNKKPMPERNTKVKKKYDNCDKKQLVLKS